jgi:hypothetical protein
VACARSGHADRPHGTDEAYNEIAVGENIHDIGRHFISLSLQGIFRPHFALVLEADGAKGEAPLTREARHMQVVPLHGGVVGTTTEGPTSVVLRMSCPYGLSVSRV